MAATMTAIPTEVPIVEKMAMDDEVAEIKPTQEVVKPAEPAYRTPASAAEVIKRPFQLAAGRTTKTTEASITFFDGTTDGEVPYIDFSAASGNQNNFKPLKKANIHVTNVRSFCPPISLDVEACEMVYAPTRLQEKDLIKPTPKDVTAAIVENIYYPECEKLVQSRTGATKVLGYHWRHRRTEKTTNIEDERGTATKPAIVFHLDNDAGTAFSNLVNKVGQEEADYWKTKRWAIINVWRPVGDIAHALPLSLIDTQTVHKEKDTEALFLKNNYKPNILAVKHSPDYKFYYASSMTPDEAWLFRDFESDRGRDLVGVPHGAIQPFDTPEDAPLRRSIEVRCLVLWDDGENQEGFSSF